MRDFSDMQQPIHPWRDIALPVAGSMGLFCLLNFCWNRPFPDVEFYRIVPAQVGVYLVSSLVAVPLLARAMRRGTLTARDLGLGPDGWLAWRRLLGLGLAIALATLLLLTLETPTRPDFADFCFWFFFLLPATMAEMLVFVCLGFCLPQRWLQARGWRRPWPGLLAGLWAGFAFGLYHYTHEEQWHQFALQLIPVMWLNLACFVATRNFELTFVVHNVVAAVGFTGAQYAQTPPPPDMNPASYFTPPMIAVLIATFAVPYLLWTALEWRYWPREA